MSSYVPAILRRLVFERANDICEYCLISCHDTYLKCVVEHIIAEKHGGPTVADNLASACYPCNIFKGTDIASLTSEKRQLFRLFNPRTDRWLDHFKLDGAIIRPLTEIGDVTVQLLSVNNADRLELREILQAKTRYPSLAAQRHLGRE
ncbi:MAG TPA: HNH endonuclease signature motif containing protein [Tepidisphaeraceae bacterium]|jgi:hypothetical protein|nr:HNH endonuclease signature motif containing protein [Tepidisphaeraceae bacterium]